MRNPKDPRLNQQPGNRLFRTAAQQTQKRGVKVPSFAIAALITLVFTGAGGAFYYLSKPPVPEQTETAAPTLAPSPTPVAPTSATMTLVTPSPSPTPEARAARMASEEGRSRQKTTKPEPPTKEVKSPRTVVAAKKGALETVTPPRAGKDERPGTAAAPKPRETAKETKGTSVAKKASGRSEARTATAAREKPAVTKSAAKKASGKAQVSAAPKGTATERTAAASTKKGPATKAGATRPAERSATGKAAAKRASTPTVPEETVVVPVGGSGGGGGEPPESAPMQRAKFNMRPESERSANTARVNKLEEFSDAPVPGAPAAKGKKTTRPAVERLPPPPEVPDVDSGGTGRDRSALEGGESRPQVAMTRPAAPVEEAPAVNDTPARSSEDYAVQYLGPEVLPPMPPARRAPVRRPMLVPRQAYARPPQPPPPPPVRRAPLVPSAMEARRMADDLRRIEGVDVQVVPH